MESTCVVAKLDQNNVIPERVGDVITEGGTLKAIAPEDFTGTL